MAAEFNLCFEQKCESFQALQALLSLSGFSADNGSVAAPGLELTIRQVTPLRASLMRAEFGFMPTTEIAFRLDCLGERQVNLERMIAAVDILLRQTAGEALLLSIAGTVILRRKQGKLMFCPDGFFWSPQRLAIIQRPPGFAD